MASDWTVFTTARTASSSGRWNADRVSWLSRRKWSRFPSARTALDLTWRGGDKFREVRTDHKGKKNLLIYTLHIIMARTASIVSQTDGWQYFIAEENVARVKRTECMCSDIVWMRSLCLCQPLHEWLPAASWAAACPITPLGSPHLQSPWKRDGRWSEIK